MFWLIQERDENRFPTWFHAYPGPSPTPSFRMWNVLEEHDENETIRFSILLHEMRVINPVAISGNSEVNALFCMNWLDWQLRERVWKINSFSDQHARLFKLLRPAPWQFHWWSACHCYLTTIARPQQCLAVACRGLSLMTSSHRHTDSKAAPLLNSGVQTGRPYYYLSSVMYTRQGVIVTWRCNRDREAAPVPYI